MCTARFTMMNVAAYPKELRARVVTAAEQGEYTIAEIARMFSIGVTFVKKMLKLHREGEALAPRHGGAECGMCQQH